MSKLIRYYYRNIYNPLCALLTGELEIEPSPSDAHNSYVGEETYFGVVQAKGKTEAGLKVEIMEAIEYDGDNIVRLGYSYQACDPEGITVDDVEKDPEDATILRYDNEPHHRVETYPDHKHVGAKVKSNYNTSLFEFVIEVNQLTEGKMIVIKNEPEK